MITIYGKYTNAIVYTVENELYALEENVDGKETELQQHHIDRLTKQECTAEAGMIFSDVVSSLERVADHAINVAKYILHVEKEEA